MEEEGEDAGSDALVTKDSQQRRGKFSCTETKLLMDYVDEKMNGDNLTMRDITSRGRTTDVKKKGLKYFWTDIAKVTPDRPYRAVYNHCIRQLMHRESMANPFTEAEKVELHRLVLEKGRKWALIGREMGRYDQQCKDVYERMRLGSLKKGEFTVEEDLQLLHYVRKFTKKKGESILQFSSNTVSWRAIAIKLGNVRHEEVYKTRWDRLVVVIRDAWAMKSLLNMSEGGLQEHTVTRNHMDEAKRAIKEMTRGRISWTTLDRNTQIAVQVCKNCELLEYLVKKNPIDESEVIWRQVDRALGLNDKEASK